MIKLKVVEDRTRAVMRKFRTFIKERAVVLIRFDNKRTGSRPGAKRKVARHRSRSPVCTRTLRYPGSPMPAVVWFCREYRRPPITIAQHKVMQPLWTRHKGNVFPALPRTDSRASSRTDNHQIRLRIEPGAASPTAGSDNALLLK